MKPNKEKLIEAAMEVFDTYPAVDSVFATADGHCFLPQAKSLALDHGRRIGSEPVEIRRSDLEKKPEAVKDPETPEDEEPVQETAPETPEDEEPVRESAPEIQSEAQEPKLESPVPQMREKVKAATGKKSKK